MLYLPLDKDRAAGGARCVVLGFFPGFTCGDHACRASPGGSDRLALSAPAAAGSANT